MGMVLMTSGAVLISFPFGSIWRIALSNWTVAQAVDVVELPPDSEESVNPCRPDHSFVTVHLRAPVGRPLLSSATLSRPPLVCWEMSRRLSLTGRISCVWAAAGRGYSTTLLAGKDPIVVAATYDNNNCDCNTEKRLRRRIVVLCSCAEKSPLVRSRGQLLRLEVEIAPRVTAKLYFHSL